MDRSCHSVISRLTRERNEHQRRAPDCVFFSIASGKSTKTSRTAKGRPSKTSRLSIESNATAHTIDDFVDNDDSAMTSMTISSTASKVTKKAGKGRKPKNTRKEAAAPEPEPIKNYDLDDVEMGEPEDAGFDIVVPVPNAKSKRSKKRTSQEMESSIQVNEGSQDAVLEPPPPKRRTTRMRGSTAKSEHVSVTEVTLKDPDDGVASSEKKDLATEKLVRSKKGVKGTRKRASSTVRKASNTSVRKASNTSAASKATLRAVGPTDEELDAALAAELDRPLPDEEIDEELLVESKGKTRRLTRNKPNSRTTSRTVSASKAPIRKPTRASTENQEDKLRLEISKVTQDHPEEELDAASQELPSLDVKPRKGGKVPKAVKLKSLKKTRETSITADTVTVSEHSAPEIVGSLMLHQDIEAEVDLEIPPIVNEEPLIQAGDISTRVSTGLTGQKRRASDITFEAEEKPVKGRKMEIKVEIQRLSSHSQQPIETANDDSVASTADDEKDRRIKKATLPKKQNARKAKGKPSKAKGVSTPHLRQPLFEPTPKQATPTAVKEAATPTNIQIYSPVVVIHVDKQAAHIEEKPPTPHENAIIPASSPSPQSSDAENHPPSTRPMEERPPLALLSPSKTQTTRAPLAASTPLTSPSKRNVAAKIRTDAPWTAIDLENVFEAINAPEDGLDLAVLSSPEKNMTVEEWILHNAARGEERLKKGCERMVAAFELEGVKALRALEGIVCID